MPHWLIKSAIQRLISTLPASHKWNEFFQTRVTRSLDLTASRFGARLEYCRRHLDHFHEFRPGPREGFTVMEIGTGWFPVVPVGLFLCGAGEIWTFDISPLLGTARVRNMLERFVEYEDSGRLRSFLPLAKPERLSILRGVLERNPASPEKMLEPLNIHARTREAQNTGLPAASVDLFTSTGVLEYIPREILKAILAECRRVGRPGALHSHYLNLVDQFSYFDSSITPFNFLRYSAKTWKYLNSPVTWQNRFRICDFRDVFRESRLQILKEVNTSGDPEALRKVKLAREFEAYKEADLLVLYSWLVGEAPAGSHAAQEVPQVADRQP